MALGVGRAQEAANSPPQVESSKLEVKHFGFFAFGIVVPAARSPGRGLFCVLCRTCAALVEGYFAFCAGHAQPWSRASLC